MAASKDARERAGEPLMWFQHDSDAAQDLKCRRLIMRHGNEGYGLYWRLCETLAAARGHALPASTEEDWMLISESIGMLPRTDFFDELDVQKCKDFVASLADIGLVVFDEEGRIKSERMTRNAAYFGTQKSNAAKGGRPRKQKPANEE